MQPSNDILSSVEDNVSYYSRVFTDHELRTLRLLSNFCVSNYEQTGKIKIHVLDVCANGCQQVYFNLGMDKLKNSHPCLYFKLSIEHRKNKFLIESQLKPSDSVDWLMEGDIHFVLSHAHQGMLLPHNQDWTVDIIENELNRLTFHPGFPQGNYLRCPIFLQNKWNYLIAVKDIILPTLKVPIPVDISKTNVIESITR